MLVDEEALDMTVIEEDKQPDFNDSPTKARFFQVLRNEIRIWKYGQCKSILY